MALKFNWPMTKFLIWTKKYIIIYFSKSKMLFLGLSVSLISMRFIRYMLKVSHLLSRKFYGWLLHLYQIKHILSNKEILSNWENKRSRSDKLFYPIWQPHKSQPILNLVKLFIRIWHIKMYRKVSCAYPNNKKKVIPKLQTVSKYVEYVWNLANMIILLLLHANVQDLLNIYI